MALYVDEETAELLGRSGPLGIFWRLNLEPPDGPLRYWMGVNDYPVKDTGEFETGLPSYDSVGDKYIGAGPMLNIPELEILINGAASEVEFFLSGVTDRALAQLDADAPAVVGTDCHVGLAPLDERWQPLSPILPVWTGTADFWTMKRDAVSGSDTPQQTLVLSCHAGDTGRSRPRRTTFTDAQQKLVHPTDKFFDRVSRYVRGYSAPWPRF